MHNETAKAQRGTSVMGILTARLLLTLKCRPGTANRDAGFLSRRPIPIEVTERDYAQECQPEVQKS